MIRGKAQTMKRRNLKILLVVLGAETAQMRNQASHILLRSAQHYYTDHGFAG